MTYAIQTRSRKRALEETKIESPPIEKRVRIENEKMNFTLNVTPTIILSTYELRKQPYDSLLKELNILHERVKKAVNYKFDHPSTKISDICGHLFTVMFSGFGLFMLWDDAGSTTLLSRAIKLDQNQCLSQKLVDEIELIMAEYRHGYIHCTHCETKIKTKEIAGRYFAGVYCEDCWENKGFKKREAKETYE